MNNIMIGLLVLGFLFVGCAPTIEEEGIVKAVEPTSTVTTVPSPPRQLMEDVELVVSTTDGMLAHWKNWELQHLTDVEGIESTIWSSPMITDNRNYVAFERDDVPFCVALQEPSEPVPLIPDVIYLAMPPPQRWVRSFSTVPNSDHLIVEYNYEESSVPRAELADCAIPEANLDSFDFHGRIVPSSDGKTAAIATTASLIMSPYKRYLEYDPVYTYTGGLRYHPTLVWPVQSDKLRIIIHPQDWMLEQRHDPTTIYEIDTKTDDVRELIKIKQMGIRVREPHTTVFSESGDWLAYYTLVPSDDTPSEIIESHRNIINLNTLEQRTILEGESANFAISKETIWSPSDEYLVYATEQVYVGENTFPSGAPLKVVRLADEAVFDVDEGAIFHGWVRDDAFVYVADSAVQLAEIDANGVVTHTILEGVSQLHDVISTYP